MFKLNDFQFLLHYNIHTHISKSSLFCANLMWKSLLRWLSLIKIFFVTNCWFFTKKYTKITDTQNNETIDKIYEFKTNN